MSVAEVPSSQADASLRAVFDLQKQAFNRNRNPSLNERRANLKKLLGVILDNEHALVEATRADYVARSPHEAQLADVVLAADYVRYCLKHLKTWMRPEKRSTPMHLLPARVKVHRQPLGVVGVISPWNYPVQLSLGPITAALAAGNRVMLKPSEFTPRTSDLLAELLASAFSEDHVAVCRGGVETGVAFGKLPFDHLLYTGSTAVGSLVMKAAAENLTPVTLELGGKSPCIIHADYPMEKAVESIASAKMFNAGQTCIAADYVLLPEGTEQRFVDLFRSAIARRYPGLRDNDDYSAVINDKHRARLNALAADAEEKGAKVVEVNPGGEDFSESPKLPPRLVLDGNDEMGVMTDEIFGPILPIVTYRSLDQALDYVNERPRPLALYYFDNDKRRVDRVMSDTISGGAVINDWGLHFATTDAPFGGVGGSGIGSYHGREGFETFSHQKTVFYQSRLNGAALLTPPYGKTIERLLNFLLG